MDEIRDYPIFHIKRKGEEETVKKLTPFNSLAREKYEGPLAVLETNTRYICEMISTSPMEARTIYEEWEISEVWAACANKLAKALR